MLEGVLVHNLWLALIVWVALYTSDYYLTIATARLYRKGVKEHITIEGSLELTPYYQGDIDALRRLSPRFLIMLALSSALLAGEWLLSVPNNTSPESFSFLLGGFLLLEVSVHTRHIRNLITYGYIARGMGARGRVEYRRWLTLRVSAADLISMGGVFLLTFLLTGSWFFTGGAAFSVVTGLTHLVRSRKFSPFFEEGSAEC